MKSFVGSYLYLVIPLALLQKAIDPVITTVTVAWSRMIVSKMK